LVYSNFSKSSPELLKSSPELLTERKRERKKDKESSVDKLITFSGMLVCYGLQFI